jgi:Sec-independent protein translocase protein TatA
MTDVSHSIPHSRKFHASHLESSEVPSSSMFSSLRTSFPELSRTNLIILSVFLLVLLVLYYLYKLGTKTRDVIVDSIKECKKEIFDVKEENKSLEEQLFQLQRQAQAPQASQASQASQAPQASQAKVKQQVVAQPQPVVQQVAQQVVKPVKPQYCDPFEEGECFNSEDDDEIEIH